MKIGYATTFDSQDVDNWSGTPFFMTDGLKNQSIQVELLGQLKKELPKNFKVKQLWKKFYSGERESPRFNCFTAQSYSRQLENKISGLHLDAIIAPQINPIAYLNCEIPIILWTDALYAGLANFYPGFMQHSRASIMQGHEVTKECLKRTRIAIFSSGWAANTAMEFYGMPQDKVKVIPFGANFHCDHTANDMMHFLKSRSREYIKLLFLGKDWQRKGGDIVLAVAEEIHARGFPIELHIVGCLPPKNRNIPSYVQCHGFISKKTSTGMIRIKNLLSTSHFLFVPSRAEAYGIVFCEANAFGLPCLSSSIGGIQTIIKNNVNG
ncbi:MAG TPA: glycosyltransferase family 4 protein, partial [Gammaproteobacteria bacterium]|nr:glycosyltransferase family 4 protein [Gammaproteobacteria bacterium]